MSTSYQMIYNVFLSKINDYNFPKLDDTTLTNILRGYLQSSIVNFNNCKQDLSQRDEVNAQFTITLTDTEVEILACYMVDSWLTVRINDDAGLKQVLTDNDYQIHSQANHTQTNLDVQKQNTSRINKLVKNYQYNDISSFTPLSSNVVQPDDDPIDVPYSPQDIIDDYYLGH